MTSVSSFTFSLAGAGAGSSSSSPLQSAGDQVKPGLKIPRELTSELVGIIFKTQRKLPSEITLPSALSILPAEAVKQLSSIRRGFITLNKSDGLEKLRDRIYQLPQFNETTTVVEGASDFDWEASILGLIFSSTVSKKTFEEATAGISQKYVAKYKDNVIAINDKHPLGDILKIYLFPQNNEPKQEKPVMQAKQMMRASQAATAAPAKVATEQPLAAVIDRTILPGQKSIPSRGMPWTPSEIQILLDDVSKYSVEFRKPKLKKSKKGENAESIVKTAFPIKVRWNTIEKLIFKRDSGNACQVRFGRLRKNEQIKYNETIKRWELSDNNEPGENIEERRKKIISGTKVTKMIGKRTFDDFSDNQNDIEQGNGPAKRARTESPPHSPVSTGSSGSSSFGSISSMEKRDMAFAPSQFGSASGIVLQPKLIARPRGVAQSSSTPPFGAGSMGPQPMSIDHSRSVSAPSSIAGNMGLQPMSIETATILGNRQSTVPSGAGMMGPQPMPGVQQTNFGYKMSSHPFVPIMGPQPMSIGHIISVAQPVMAPFDQPDAAPMTLEQVIAFNMLKIGRIS
ncbi:MAG: hypothetical protein H0W88_02360 [Parachlamydiaceae bacterium]|nr:hypothetical protein [Parachlamydiaceae bacterium]